MSLLKSQQRIMDGIFNYENNHILENKNSEV